MRIGASETSDFDPSNRDEAPPQAAAKPTSASAAQRMDAWLRDDDNHPAVVLQASVPAAPGDFIGPPACNFLPWQHDFQRCGAATVVGPLFVQGKGDVDAVDGNDIRQRKIGDCYFLAPLKAMLQSPEGRARVHEMIKEVKRDGQTTYDVTFRVPVQRSAQEKASGALPYEEKKVTIGQVFVNGHVATGDAAPGGQAEVWPLVLESAYARLFGGHEQLIGGVAPPALERLTGKSAFEVTLTEGRYSPAILQRDFREGKPMCVTFILSQGPSAPAIPAYDAFGLHVYELKDIYEKDGQTYVQLSNPWGYRDPKPIPLSALEALHPRVSVGQRPDPWQK